MHIIICVFVTLYFIALHSLAQKEMLSCVFKVTQEGQLRVCKVILQLAGTCSKPPPGHQGGNREIRKTDIITIVNGQPIPGKWGVLVFCGRVSVTAKYWGVCSLISFYWGENIHGMRIGYRRCVSNMHYPEIST